MISDKTLSKAVLDASFPIHSDLGPGLLERVYECGGDDFLDFVREAA